MNTRPNLEKGDRVMLLYMEDKHTDLSPGTWGTVTDSVVVMGVKQYGVNWDDGTKDNPGKVISRLALLSDVDMWTKGDTLKKVNETKVNSKKKVLEQVDDSSREVLLNFKMSFFHKYLNVLQQTGIANMITESSPYLYMGANRLKHEFTYKEPPNEEAFEKLVDLADESQANMIDGVMKVLKNKNKEVSLENINYYLKRYSTKIVSTWVTLFYT